MFCKECGNELKDGAMFCGKCGTKVVSEASTEEVPAEEVPVEEVPVEETTTEEVTAEADPQISAPQEMPKKKKKFPKIIAIVAAVVLVLGGGFLLFKDAIMNKLMPYRSAETQLQYAYSNTAQDWGEFTGELVTEVSKITDTSEGTATAIFSVSIGDGVKSILESSSGMDLGDINTVYVSCKVSYNENQMSYDLAVGLEKTNLLSASIVLDVEEGLIAVSIPELSDTAIELNFEEDLGIDMQEVMTAMPSVDVYMEQVEEFLPDAELIEDMVPRYVEAIIKAMSDVESEKGTIEVEGVSQKATAFTVHFNDDMLRKIGTAIAEEIEKDEELETYLKELLSGEVFGLGIDDKTWDGMYETLVKGVEQAFSGLADEFTADIEIVTWVDSDYEIIGFEMDDVIKFLSAKDGKEVATKFVITEPDEGEFVKIAIVGQESGDEFAGDITLYVEEEEIITIQVDKYVSTDDEFELDASITIPTDMIEDLIGMKNPLGAVTLKVEISATEEEADISLKGIIAGSEWIALNYKMTSEDEADITYPEDTMGVDEIEEWINTIDFSSLIDSAKDLGILDMLGIDEKVLKESLGEIFDYYKDYMLNGDSYYDDFYDYDFEYDY